ncbi:MAG: hypothetical protein HGB05_16505 [Chloroflexi bacterium]|nr:hypothetical protein [Chloroflexota bacterium]
MGTFACPINNITPTLAYRFPIRVEVLTSDGVSLVTEGVLRGLWDENVRLQLPLDADILQAIRAQPAAADLLRDHVIERVSYLALTNPITSSNRTAAGRIILLSQIEWNGQPVRYTVGTPVVLQEGKLARWDLTREALDQLLQDVLRLPLTQRVLSAAPDTMLNLGYAEEGLHPIISEHGHDRMVQSFQLTTCGQVISQTLPRPGMPLRTFAFSQGISGIPYDFILIDNQPVAYWLNLDPTQGEIFSLLLPAPLRSEQSAVLDNVDVSGDFPYGPELTISLPFTLTNPLEPLQAIAATLPVTAELDSEASSLTARDVTVRFTDDGRLEIVKCQP